jgi:hypothetical protein
MRTRRQRDSAAEPARQWIAPGTATAFSALMMFLTPVYARVFGAALPPFTRAFLALYPAWFVIGLLALLVAVVGEQFALAERWRAPLRALDTLLTIACVLIVAAGIIALFLPLLIRSEPG